ncbi:2-hydroxy-6-oxononadienedioate/2-hydroxy-6-oxononatrienedioate hydrolase-like protein [Cladobotryum mycophilum]|uniref:2-hydroxy-6-oxononadienedioate/2-hydroxy-6-oxononatrienedioate hydrolase-like protein n=1 Tax=Cladobotryum mycophilum TaxID=491253 RepID=A0ABR0STK6_9HYPO
MSAYRLLVFGAFVASFVSSFFGLTVSAQSITSYGTAEPEYINVNGTRFAYLRFGSTGKTHVPLVFLQHFRGTFDHWDPDLLDPIAAVRPVILIDNSGVGKSNGTVPGTYAEWAQHIISIIEALDIPLVDVLGFSMGGYVAQMTALNAPAIVRRLILAGTGPSAGVGIESGETVATERLAIASNDKEEHDAFLEAFYSLTPEKQALGDKWWKRMTTARSNRSDFVGPDGTRAQIGASTRWGSREFAIEGSYDRLHEIKIPVFVANGDSDILIPTVNSWVMFNKLTNADAHLHIFPDVGHGFLNEYADQFSKLINIFLDA